MQRANTTHFRNLPSSPASRRDAAGHGLRIDQAAEIEEGAASDALRNLYAQWLDRLESWPADKRASQLLAAQENLQRFRP
jgi:hypothetical protein